MWGPAARGFGHSLGVWERVPADRGGCICIYDTRKRSPRDVFSFETAVLSLPPSRMNCSVCELLGFFLLCREGLR